MRLAIMLLLVGLLQGSTPDVHMKFKNGSEVRARLVEVKDGSYVVDLADGRRVTYPVADVESLSRLDGPATSAEPARQPAPAAPAESICRVFVTSAKVPAAWATLVKKVKWSKRWYGGASGAFEKLAIEAAKVRGGCRGRSGSLVFAVWVLLGQP